MVIGEEVSQAGYKAVRSRESKTRYIGGVIAPESPVYMAGLLDEDVDADLVTAYSPPVVGIAATTAGYSVFEANVELLEVSLHENLSEEAVRDCVYDALLLHVGAIVA